MDVLSLSGVDFAYDAEPVLTDVSFGIDQGEFVGVVGPNGSGKSTLLKLADRILKPSGGEVSLMGRPVAEYSRKHLARTVAMVPQEFELDFDFSVREVIEMGRYARRGESRSRFDVDALLERLEISALADRRFPQLSGGEKQMVVLAQSLAQEPDLLLLDEPASHLDVSFQLHIFDTLKRLNTEGMTLLCVLHDLNLALIYCRRSLMLSRGALVADGDTEEVLDPARLESVYGVKAYMHKHAGRTFLTFSPSAVGRLDRRIHLVCGGGTGAFLMRALTDLGFTVTAGVVNAMDTDEVTGRELGLALAAEAAFSEISDRSYRENMDLIEAADLVVMTDVPIGPGNRRNVEAVREALGSGKDVLLIGDSAGKDPEGGLSGIRALPGDDAVVEEVKKRWVG